MITNASIQINKKEQAISASLGNCHLLIEFKLLVHTQVKFKLLSIILPLNNIAKFKLVRETYDNWCFNSN